MRVYLLLVIEQLPQLWVDYGRVLQEHEEYLLRGAIYLHHVDLFLGLLAILAVGHPCPHQEGPRSHLHDHLHPRDLMKVGETVASDRKCQFNLFFYRFLACVRNAAF